MSDKPTPKELFSKLNSETAKIPWHELQKFFASGNAIFVDPKLDLVEVAHKLAEDDIHYLKPLTETNQFAPVTDEQARAWYTANEVLWAVVVSPWVLVQEQTHTK